MAGGYRYQSHRDLSAYVERFVLDGQSARMSAAALETLAIVAYKQPLSRAQVSAIRGVNVDGVMRTLQHRGYIAEVARDPGPGQAVLFGTTADFLQRLGLDSLDDLPSLAEFVPGPDVVEALEQGLRVGPRRRAPGRRRRRPTAPSRARRPTASPRMPGPSEAGEPDKLQKVLARAGVGSRRDLRGDDRGRPGHASTAWWPTSASGSIPRGRPSRSTGCPWPPTPPSSHYLLNKPAGVVTTADDPQGRPTVIDLVPAEPRVFPVGRLDLDTEGLLVVTNDGALAHRLTHPSFGIEKEYLAEVEGTPSRGVLPDLARGGRARRRPHRPRQRLGGRRRASCASPSTRVATARCGACARRWATPCSRLVRTRIGPIADRSLAPGAWRPLTPEEVQGAVRRIRGVAEERPVGSPP